MRITSSPRQREVILLGIVYIASPSLKRRHLLIHTLVWEFGIFTSEGTSAAQNKSQRQRYRSTEQVGHTRNWRDEDNLTEDDCKYAERGGFQWAISGCEI